MRHFLIALLFLPLMCFAEAQRGTGSASARVQLVVTVLPIFRVMQVTQSGDQYVYKVFTNMRTVTINDQMFWFDHVGEQTFTLSIPPSNLYVYQP